MALGIMAVTLIPLMGIMAMGLGQVRSNIDNNQAANISQQVLLEARQMNFTTLKGMGTYYRYFNNQGDANAQADANTSANSQVLYTAKVTVTTSALPGGDASQPTLATVKVQVRKTPGGIDPATNPNVATFVSMISCDDLDYSGNSGM